ncbi:MAG: response regulator [Acidobacteria bacterium]|jgi:DNA-binding response OmpR family regulator|nr:response regulator [Acidobacteriota bacterium]
MSKTILVIEDNEKHGNLYKAILRKEGFQVVIAKNGDEVKQNMAAIKAKGNCFDLLLVDIAVPGFDAVEFISAHKETYRILVVSAYADEDNVKQILEEKWRIKKPFDINVLIKKINERLLPIKGSKK